MHIKKIDVPFTQVANSILRDPEISFRAKGMFAYIYSKPENWDFASDRIASESTDGIEAVRSALKELEDAGYLVRKKLPSGRMTYEIGYMKKPKAGKPTEAKTHRGKSPPISNKDIQSNKDRTEVAAPSETARVRLKTDPVNLSIEIDKMLEKKQRHVQIIGAYMSYRVKSLKSKITTFGQFDQVFRRHLPYASKLTNWNDDQLNKAFQEVEVKNKDIDWTLETVYKHLTK